MQPLYDALRDMAQWKLEDYKGYSNSATSVYKRKNFR
jgi:hypothetical protein